MVSRSIFKFKIECFMKKRPVQAPLMLDERSEPTCGKGLGGASEPESDERRLIQLPSDSTVEDASTIAPSKMQSSKTKTFASSTGGVGVASEPESDEAEALVPPAAGPELSCRMALEPG